LFGRFVSRILIRSPPPTKCAEVHNPFAVFVLALAKGWKPHSLPRTDETPEVTPGLDPGIGHSANDFQSNPPAARNHIGGEINRKRRAKRGFDRRRPQRLSAATSAWPVLQLSLICAIRFPWELEIHTLLHAQMFQLEHNRDMFRLERSARFRRSTPRKL
jgi:hypothetical protein